MHTSVQRLNFVKNKVREIIDRKQLKTVPQIIAVTKSFSLNKISPLLEVGHIHFGENKIQEAESKWSDIKNKYKDLQLHMLGKLQSNKVKKAVKLSTPGKETRIKAFFQAIFNLWQRTQQANNLTNPQPDLITIIFRKDKSLTMGDKLRIDTQYNLDIPALMEALEYHKNEISLAYVASHESFLNNYDFEDNGDPLIYVCKNYVCDLPTSDIEVILSSLENK